MIGKIKKLFLNPLLANYYGPTSAIILSLIFTPLLIFQVGIRDWAFIGIISLLQPFIYLFGLGLNNVLNREIINLIEKKNEDYYVSGLYFILEKINIITSILLFLSIYILAPFIVFKYQQSSGQLGSNPNQAMIMVSLILALRMLEVFYASALNGIKKHFYLNIMLLISSIIKWVGGFLLLIYFKNSILIFLFWFGITSLIFVIFVSIQTRKFIPHTVSNKWSLTSLIKIRGFATSMSIIIILGIIAQQFDKVIILHVGNINQIAYYALAVTIVGSIPQIVNPMLSFIAPELNHLNITNNINKLKSVYLNTLQLIFAILFPICLFIAFYSEELVFLWIQNSTIALNTSSIMSALCFGFFFLAISSHLQNICISFKITHSLKISLLLMIFILVSSLFLIIPKYGIVGFAYSWTVCYFIFYICNSIYVFNKILKENFINFIFNKLLINLILISLTYITIDKLYITSIKTSHNYTFIFFILCLTLLISFLTTPYPRSKIINVFKKIKLF